MKLTKAQVEMLSSALEWTEHADTVGVVPRGAGECATIRSLRNRGLVECVGFGKNIDGVGGDFRELPIYAITEAGRAALAEAEGRRKP